MATPDSTKHSIHIKTADQIQTAVPTSDNLIHDLVAALSGGDAVYEFFSGNIQALQDLYTTIATSGDSVWLDGEDEKTGNPVKFVENGPNALSVGVIIDDKDTIDKGTGSTTTYKQVGSAYVTLTTDQGTSQLIVHTIEYAGYGIAGLAITPALMKLFIKPIVRVVVNFIKNLAAKVFNRAAAGETTPDVDEAEENVANDADSAAGEASETAAEIGADTAAEITLTVAETVGLVVGLALLGAMLIINLLEKQMTNWVKFFNVTQEDIQFGLCKTMDGTGAKMAPTDVGKTITVKGISKPVTPPWIISTDQAITRSDLQFINSNLLNSIGYVLNAEPSGDFPGFRIVVFIPLVGENSLYVGFTDGECDSMWSHLDTDGTNDLTMKATSGKYTLRIATNVNSGKSASPIDATEGYNYEHLIVLTDGSVPE